MKRRVGYFGALGLVTLLFGILGEFLLAYDEYHFVPLHLGIGVVSLLIFFIGGGLQGLRGVSVRRKAGFGLGAVLYTILFLGVLVVLNLWTFRHDPLHFDSTEAKAYTLAPESLSILQALPKKVIARSFSLGGKLDPAVETLLKRFAKASPNFTWTVIDPEKKPQLVDQFGISQSGTVHFSFEGEDGKREAKIARDISEQEIVNALRKLTRGEGKKVYLLIGHGEAELDSQTESGYLFLKDSIEGENLKIERLNLGEKNEVPKDAAALLVLGPKKALLPQELQRIQAYLAAGGPAVFAAEPHSTSDIANLVQPLGILVGNDIVIERSLSGFGVQSVVAQYGVHPITSAFAGSTVFNTVCSVSKSPAAGDGVRITELAFTGENSWAEKDVEKIYSEKPEAVPNPEERHGPVPIAAAFEGLAPYKTAEGVTPEKTRIVVLGDVDFVSNTNIRQLYNADFFLNSLNWALGEEQGVTIRPRTLKQSSKIISQDQMSRVFLFGGVVFPELLLLLGLFIWWRRKS